MQNRHELLEIISCIYCDWSHPRTWQEQNGGIGKQKEGIKCITQQMPCCNLRYWQVRFCLFAQGILISSPSLCCHNVVTCRQPGTETKADQINESDGCTSVPKMESNLHFKAKALFFFQQIQQPLNKTAEFPVDRGWAVLRWLWGAPRLKTL